MKRLHLFGLFLSVAVIGALTFTSAPAQAACTGPAGDEGTMIYNGDHKVAQFCNGTDWIGMAGGNSSAAADSMVAGWPDAIVCNLTTPAWGTVVLYAMHMPIGASYYYRNQYTTSGAVYDVIFNSDGTFQGFQGITVTPDCNGKSIAQLYSDGQAFNFVGGQGDGVNDTLSGLSCSSGQVAQWNGSAWACAAAASGGKFVDGTNTNDAVYTTGNVGIGTTAPDVNLHVENSAADSNVWVATENDAQQWLMGVRGDNSDTFQIVDNTGGTDTRLAIDTAGNVGIGTTTPNSILEIHKDGHHAIKFTGSSGAKKILLGNQDSGGVNNPSMISGENGNLRFGGGDSWTDAHGGTEDISMSILDNGNVGIGTTSPGSKLHLYSTDNALNYLDVQNVSTTDSAGSIIRLITTDTADTGVSVVNLVKYNSGGFVISNSETDAAAYIGLNLGGSERMRITSSGNVGIGTISPTAALQIGDKDAEATPAGSTLILGSSATGSNEGGELQLHTAADHDTIIDSFVIDAHQDDLRIRRTATGSDITLDSSGNVVIGATAPSDGSGSGGQALKLDVAGAVGATHYCDADGLNCTAAASLGGGDNLGSGGTTTGNMIMNNTSPTLFLQDTDHASGMIHMNGNLMHFLSGGTNSTAWTINGSHWPMTINTVTDTVTIGGTLSLAEGNIGMNNHKVTGLGTPTAATDAATKAYVDAAAGGGGLGGQQLFTATGNFTVPAGVSNLKVTLVGGGGGGAGSTGGTPGSAGGIGGYRSGYLAVTGGQVITCTVGAGGAGGNWTGSPGGGSTSFSTMSAGGGGGCPNRWTPGTAGSAGSGGTGSIGYAGGAAIFLSGFAGYGSAGAAGVSNGNGTAGGNGICFIEW